MNYIHGLRHILIWNFKIVSLLGHNSRRITFFCLVLNHHCLWATACIFSAAKQIKATKSFAFLDCVGMTLFGYGFEILARLTAFVRTAMHASHGCVSPSSCCFSNPAGGLPLEPLGWFLIILCLLLLGNPSLSLQSDSCCQWSKELSKHRELLLMHWVIE